jgi:UDP-N-acetylglucosamine--N-acetylmuramyl-(pentapeptide) pyrophosphoryl-undecaprenol N-acetylglucosamine transferase
MKKKILITAGGTGGHVYPGLAVAEKLLALGHEVNWVGSLNSFESHLLEKTIIPFDALVVSGVRKKLKVRPSWHPWGWLEKVGFGFSVSVMLGRAVQQGLVILKKYQPDVVLGFGGYASGPMGIAAKIYKIPLVVHEQNAVMGLTNRVLSRVASRVLLGFPTVMRVPQFLKTYVTGNPLRSQLKLEESFWKQKNDLLAGLKAFDTQRPLKLLVVGGSSGALALNKSLPQILKALSDSPVQVWHQTGKNWLEDTQAIYKNLNIQPFKLEPYIESMQEAYQWADVILCRAGALTVAEICQMGIPAIFVPLPSAVDDHQWYNTQQLVAIGGAFCVRQLAEYEADIVQHIRSLLSNPALCQKMAIATVRCGYKEAVQSVVEQVLAVANTAIIK